tara:strand:- start:58193 stop:59986 length:1794 start_codon:yes stop_codon:yes gene_type:complete
MSQAKRINESAYSVFAKLLFLAIFIYLILRAYFVEPLHDEVATFFHYIETGIFWGDEALLDANNHLLNSFLSHQLYLWFGPNFFFLRLPNLLSFILFYWALYQLVKPINKALLRGVLLVALAGIPFILDYFAYTRGYGISLAFFLAALVFLIRFTKTLSSYSIFIAYLFLVIAVYANLTYLLSCVLAIGFVIIIQLLNLKKIKKITHFSLLSFHGVLVLSILPAINFAEKLREGGALYYGSLEGFWEVTGKTITNYTLFFDANWFKWVLLLMGILLIATLLYIWKRKGTLDFFLKNETVIAWFLFGHIGAILFLAHFRGVNYPEDRVGMYLIPLSILLFAYILNNWKWSSYGILILLVFPILFITKINLNTSVFSPQDRMSDSFFNEVIKEVNPKSSISVYPLMRLSWAWQDRKQEIKNTVSDLKSFNTAADIVLTREVLQHKKSELDQYVLFTKDENSGFLAYRRKKPFVKSVVFDSTFTVNETEAEYISFGNFYIPDSLRNKKLQIHVEGQTSTSAEVPHFNFIYSTLDKNGNSVIYEGWGLHWSNGLKKNFLLNYNYPINCFEKEDYEVRVYLWNINKEKIAVKNGKFELISLE